MLDQNLQENQNKAMDIASAKEIPDVFKENIVKNQTAAEINDANISAVDGITTPSQEGKTNEIPPAENNKVTQGEISQEEAIAAIQQNRKLRRENAELKKRLS